MKSHTRVDFLLGHLPRPLRAVLNATIFLLLAGLVAFAIVAGAYAARGLLLVIDWRQVNHFYGRLPLEEEVPTEDYVQLPIPLYILPIELLVRSGSTDRSAAARGIGGVEPHRRRRAGL